MNDEKGHHKENTYLHMYMYTEVMTNDKPKFAEKF